MNYSWTIVTSSWTQIYELQVHEPHQLHELGHFMFMDSSWTAHELFKNHSWTVHDHFTGVVTVLNTVLWLYILSYIADKIAGLPLTPYKTRIVFIRPKGRTQCMFPLSQHTCLYIYWIKSEFISISLSIAFLAISDRLDMKLNSFLT